MQRSLSRFVVWMICLACIAILPAQQTSRPVPSLPADLLQQADSLRKADNLTEWLYTYRAYVYDDPVSRIGILIDAQANAWRRPGTAAERTEWFNCLAAQGYYLLYAGRILQSIDAYEQAYRFYFDDPVPDADVLEYVLKPLGNNYTRLGDYDRAYFIQEKSLALAIASDSSQVASICHNLATTCIWKEDLELARLYCEKGLTHAKQSSAMQGLLLSTLAEVYLRFGKTDTAELNSWKAIGILSAQLREKQEKNTAYWLRGAWQGLGDIQNANRDAAAALVSYSKALQLVETHFAGDRKREQAKLAVSMGRVLLQLQQPARAIASFDSALTWLLPAYKPRSVDALPRGDDLYGENTLLDALHGKADCLGMIGKKETSLNCYLLLYNIEKKLRKEFFSTAAKQQQQKESRRWAESAIETAYDLWNTSGRQEYAEKVLLIAEMSKAQLLLDEMVSNLHYSRLKRKDSLADQEWRMTQAINFYEKEADSNNRFLKKELQYKLSLLQKEMKARNPMLVAADILPTTAALLKSIDSNTRVIEFFAGERNIYRVDAGNGRVQQLQRIVNADTVLRQIKRFNETFFQAGAAKMMNEPEAYYKEAYSIYDILFRNAALGAKDHIIIPDGLLGYLPFDALVTDPEYRSSFEQWPFLARKVNVYLAYSLQTRIQQLDIKHTSNEFAGFFISFDSSRSALPAVRKEYEAIHAVIKGSYYTDDKASLNNFEKQLNEANLLHISTHSFLQGEQNVPVLQFADDRFFLFELYVRAAHPQLVVLSACRTGHGMLAQGEGIISLARGFTATGASGIVAGLWDMNDETTASLVGSFYSKLGAGAAPAAALHQAKLEWLAKKDIQSFQKLPYFWAGMMYCGDNSMVNITAKNKFGRWWMIAAGLLIVAIFVYSNARRSKTAKTAKHSR